MKCACKRELDILRARLASNPDADDAEETGIEIMEREREIEFTCDCDLYEEKHEKVYSYGD